MKIINVVAAIIEHKIKYYVCDVVRINMSILRLNGNSPGGKIEEGETKENALKREILEEMDLNVKIEKHFYDVCYTYPDFKLNMFCCNVPPIIKSLK